MTAIKIALAVSTALAVGCRSAAVTQSSNQLSPDTRTAVADTIRHMTADLIRAVDRVNASEAFAFFSNSADFAGAGMGAIYTSVEPLRRLYTGIYAGLQSDDIRLSESKITVLSPRAAVFTAAGTFSNVDKAGNVSPRTPMSLTLVWVREPAGWKILNTHESFGQPLQ